MSGGHFNYFYGQIRDILGGEMEDPELNALVEDFADLCKDLEWLKSGDDSEETYRTKRLETVNGRSGRLMSSTFSRPLRSSSIFLIYPILMISFCETGRRI